MKIVIVGYGKMGKELEKAALSRGHHISGIATENKPLSKKTIQDADAAIDFTTPDAVLENISFLIENNIPTIVGTTGWNDHLDEITQQVNSKNGVLVHASNFSVGVNLFFKLNEQLSELMREYTDYIPSIQETHHTEKLDAPSGTAITLGEGIIKLDSRYTDWKCPQNKEHVLTQNPILIEAIRKPDVKGTHEITYASTIDTISIQHKAHNREGFALGAIMAAEWAQHKKGIFTMKDVLQLS